MEHFDPQTCDHQCEGDASRQLPIQPDVQPVCTSPRAPVRTELKVQRYSKEISCLNSSEGKKGTKRSWQSGKGTKNWWKENRVPDRQKALIWKITEHYDL